MNTKKLLENISEDCSDQLTKYKYNKGLNISEKYRKGKIISLQYVLDLIYHFYEKDKQLKIEFENILTSQIEDTSKLKDGDYKNGITEVLSRIKTQLNEK
jgi:hypothetical protein